MVALLHSDRSKATMLRSHRTRAAASSSGGAPAPKWSADTARRAARTQEPATMRFTDVWFSRTLRFAIGASAFADRCRNREVDDLLFHDPGRDRGTPA
jgi:hypothetical protein